MSGIEEIAVVVSAVAAVGGAAVGAVGAEKSAEASKAAANYQAQVASNNAIIQQQNATQAQQKGEADAAAQAMATRQQAGKIKAAEAASGVDVNSPSSLDVQSSAAQLGELDALTIRSNYSRSVYGYETAANSQTAQSQLDVMAGKNASTAGNIGAATSLLSGATSLGTQYLSWQKAGLFTGAGTAAGAASAMSGLSPNDVGARNPVSATFF